MTAPLYDKLIAEFENSESASGTNGDLSTIRNTAFDLFKAKGFPTLKDEDWRFTNLGPFLTDDFSFVTGEAEEDQVIAAVNKATIPGLNAYLLVLLNGKIQPALSVLPDAEHISIHTTNSISDSSVFSEFASLDAKETNRMLALNTALFTDGYFLEVHKNVVLDKPIQIVNLYAADDHAFFQPRHLVIVNQNAKAELIETSIFITNGHRAILNSVIQADVKENAQLIQYNIQNNLPDERLITYNQVRQEQNSRYDNFTFNLPGAELIRNNLEIELNGSNTETHLFGLYLVGGQQLTDNHTAIHHKFPHCESNEVYKGVLLENGKAVFNGKVFVERPAQKTNAFQQNNNLLLSDKAQVFAKPQLEIYADDVKCSHGCTVGQFDPESLFYLRARGISEESARKLLVEAFMFDVTQKISNEVVKEYVQSLIYSKMENSFSSVG
ncbi:MAG: Fe-S cluster assembly protein SufD [Pedobacter sp.]|uniref:Fe-S cluster assembly protein SufD n=1 Tax=Pedobacter sp. TaxID=1411316 RepID=UPI00339271DC